jgi:hypothetical protein
MNTQDENKSEDILTEFDESEEDEEVSEEEMPLSGSAMYPRIYIGDSAKPLPRQSDSSYHFDDNVTNTYMGMLTSFYG